MAARRKNDDVRRTSDIVKGDGAIGTTPEQSWELEALKFYRAEIALEFELLNQRVNGFLAAQAFLLGAFAVALGFRLEPQENWFVHVLVAFGTGISGLIWFGIDGACDTVDMWLLKQRNLLLVLEGEHWGKLRSNRDDQWIKDNQGGSDDPATLESDRLHNRSFWFPKRLPALTAIMWLVLWMLFFYYPLLKDGQSGSH